MQKWKDDILKNHLENANIFSTRRRLKTQTLGNAYFYLRPHEDDHRFRSFFTRPHENARKRTKGLRTPNVHALSI